MEFDAISRRPNVDVGVFSTSTAFCDLDFDLQNLIRSSVGTTEYPL